MKLDYQNALLLVLCLVLLLSVFTLSVSADSSDTPSMLTPNERLYVGRDGSYQYYAVTSSSGLYAFTYKQGSSYFVCLVSESSGTSYTLQYCSLNDPNNVVTSRSYNLSYLDTSTSLYYYQSALGLTSVSLPVYSSFSEGASAVREFIDNPPDNTSTLEYSLPPGNVAYIPIPRGQSSAITFTLTTTYYMAFGNNDTSRINQVVTVMSALPSSTNNVAPSSPKIPWTNNGNVNLLGVSANKIYQGSIPTSYGGQYLVVVNPMTMPSQTGLIGGDTYTNGSINISVSAVSGSPHIYPMSESLTITPGDGIGSESSYGDTGFTYEVDPETGEIIWTDPEGGSSAPIAGGNNPMPTPNTIFDWLRNISQQLSDFLRGPVQAVQVVVSAIRDFMGSFTQLYQWLPSPVYSLITSALMIALTIGVIKIFV